MQARVGSRDIVAVERQLLRDSTRQFCTDDGGDVDVLMDDWMEQTDDRTGRCG